MVKRRSEFCRENVEWLMHISAPKADWLTRLLVPDLAICSDIYGDICSDIECHYKYQVAVRL